MYRQVVGRAVEENKAGKGAGSGESAGRVEGRKLQILKRMIRRGLVEEDT